MTVNTQSNQHLCPNCIFYEVCQPNMLAQLKHIQPWYYLPRRQRLHWQQPQRYLYILRSGLLKDAYINSHGHEIVHRFIWPNTVLGWGTGADDQLRHFFEAVQASRLCAIAWSTLQWLACQNSHLATKVMALITTTQQPFPVDYFSPAEQRVYDFLCHLSAQSSTLAQQDWISIPMAYYDMAHFLGLSPETLSRSLHQLAKQGQIKLAHRRFKWTS